MTILYADDDSDDCELLTEILATIDPSIMCITASDGREAIALLNNQAQLPDYIFLDVNMPVMDGKKCLSEIKKHPRFRNIPVIIYSTTNNLEEKAHMQKLGAFDFIHKANSFQELRRSLRDLIARLQK